LEKLAINKKITAFFADGSQKMNLGVAAVVDLLKGTEWVQVQIAPVSRRFQESPGNIRRCRKPSSTDPLKAK
jgi:hypothetical protein